jgi:hypothetical protein
MMMMNRHHYAFVKPMECTEPRGSSNVSRGHWVTGHVNVGSSRTDTTLLGMLITGEAEPVQKLGICGNSALLAYFCCESKVVLKRKD